MHNFYMLIKIRNTKRTVHYCDDKVASPLFADPIRENHPVVKSFSRNVEFIQKERNKRLSCLYGVRLMCVLARGFFSEILAVFCRKFNQRESSTRTHGAHLQLHETISFIVERLQCTCERISLLIQRKSQWNFLMVAFFIRYEQWACITRYYDGWWNYQQKKKSCMRRVTERRSVPIFWALHCYDLTEWFLHNVHFDDAKKMLNTVGNWNG